MALVADFLLGCGALTAAVYCLILSRRLAALNRLEGGMGTAIAVLSSQVDELNQALVQARKTAGDSSAALEGRTLRAEQAVQRLELLLATMHDLPEPMPAGRRQRGVRHHGRTERMEAAE